MSYTILTLYPSYKALFMTISLDREQFNQKILKVSKNQLRAIKKYHQGREHPYMSMNLIMELLIEKEFKRLELDLVARPTEDYVVKRIRDD